MGFVGHGCGDYTVVTTYKYVGQGQGEYGHMKPKGNSVALLLGLLLLLLVAVAIAIALLTTTTTTRESSGQKDCMVWGDPHIQTFDGSIVDLFEQGEGHLVRSAGLNVQARFLATPFTNGLASTESIAITGKFLGGHTLIIGPMDKGEIRLDGEPALTSFPSSANFGDVHIHYSDEGELVDGAQKDLEKRIVSIQMGWKGRIEVMRWANHINAKISLTEGFGDGYCGNANGLAADDTKEAIQARVGSSVAASERLFHHLTPVKPLPVHTLEECQEKNPGKYEQALKECGHAASPELRAPCVFDVCFADAHYAAQDAMMK